MQSILDQYGPMMGLIGLALSIVLLAAVAWLAIRLRANAARWSELMKGATGQNIESLLQQHMQHTGAINGRLDGAERRLDALEAKMECAKRFVGVVRFDAFEDVGGAQSFALAVYDDKGDGAILTSMVGRTDCRVYAKEIRKGRADRELSAEEQAAVEAALKPREAPTASRAGR
jgi:hypothetical protein